MVLCPNLFAGMEPEEETVQEAKTLGVSDLVEGLNYCIFLRFLMISLEIFFRDPLDI